MAGAKPGPTGLINTLEETLIALLLGLMTLITFANVVARFVFNSNILWALELTVFLFAWLVLLGASYAVKVHAHLGVDAILNMVSPGARRVIGLISVGCCLVFSLLLLKGAYDYWAVFADLPPTSGRWFPTGFDMKARSQSFYEVQDVPMVAIFGFLEDLINYGDSYEKLPKVVPYVVLPLSMLLMLLRFAQAAMQILRGDVDRLVASHEVEDEIAEVQAQRGEHD
ncbi:TRAP transporter small permease [Phaeobacter inhibens]|uniref:TRAP transporter small permease protein n=1 Tax=Phaeobacter inhibens TaxID=221822 RepID=A0A2I7JUP7_9RHOB|nr:MULTISPECIES: TRAP transporter small permease [Phaeobacter]AFO87942.1 TRAP transporter, subunit DctQ [Phaeobacter inhibens 2.10]AFO91752.1 TRAP transporter, subunit DctQ [Phaeobacter inhibens DSM 17395]APX15113.1 TRAP transporter small permease protein [Phaeobacter inhibens]AUQ46419.1 TRAP transporter, subunit DctQ [Phaeobacter inhibens]AUQ49536.1 TRAP transporter, subunit DctQ [Phaeobacter inhibens]